MFNNFYGNFYLENKLVKVLGDMVDEICFKVLCFFGVDLEYFDLVFIVNVMVVIKFVVDLFWDLVE